MIDEAQLIRRIRGGDREACAKLVRHHYARVYQLLARLMRDSHAAEDLCQETFAAAWTKIGTFAGNSNFATWLHRIAYRRFVDWSRAGRRRERGHPSLASQQQAGPPIDRMLIDERARKLDDALDRLDPPLRDVLVLHYLHGLSFRETADVLEEPAATVRWRATKALARLRELLKDENEHELAGRKSREPAEESARAPGATLA